MLLGGDGDDRDADPPLVGRACTIAEVAEVISDFRVMGEQQELAGLIASVPPRGARWMRSPAAGGRRCARSVPR